MPVRDARSITTGSGRQKVGHGAATNREQFAATTKDIQAALDALHDLGNPFTLATSGWVLGPAHDRAALDALPSPKTAP